MRLSEAILLGSTLVDRMGRRDVRVCAIGMANRATGYVPRSRTDGIAYSRLQREWPWTAKGFLIPYMARIFFYFDFLVTHDHASMDQLILCVQKMERRMTAKGINVEQVVTAATPETTGVPDSEHIPEVEVVIGGA